METQIASKQEKTKGQAFTEYAIMLFKKDTAFTAALRRADNPATENQAWEYLVNWCDLKKPWERLPFAIVGAALAKAKPATDGIRSLGQAIADSFEGGCKADSAKAKLRRLLACDSIEELCVILRPLLSLVISRGVRISFARLLDDLRFFNEYTKARWASDFYGRRGDNDSLGI
ncbi:MAG: type I-E CRISPR-associated protein Cse2/CasB [PVC group bacterium]|nr:type I-E CRISPR-associated protein Cse2/CasB [PVC group bacterium]